MSRVVGIPKGSDDREAAFADLWQRANAIAPGQVKAVGGLRVRVPNAVADQLESGAAPSTPSVGCAEGQEPCPECGKCLKDVPGHLARVHNIEPTP